MSLLFPESVRQAIRELGVDAEALATVQRIVESRFYLEAVNPLDFPDLPLPTSMANAGVAAAVVVHRETGRAPHTLPSTTYRHLAYARLDGMEADAPLAMRAQVAGLLGLCLVWMAAIDAQADEIRPGVR
jgi:hypothetical protein